MLFIFFVVVFILLVAWGYIIRTIRKFRKAAMDAAEQQEKRYREETGRQRQQYSQREQYSQTGQQRSQTGQQSNNYQRAEDVSDGQDDEVHRYETPTGETIIDRRQKERESKKIFDDDDGEYVEFIEEKS